MGFKRPQVQILSSRPRRSKVRFASTFLYKKVIRPLPCFSSFAKSLAWLTCSVVNALTTARCNYQLFARFILIRYEHSHHIEAKFALLRFFMQKIILPQSNSTYDKQVLSRVLYPAWLRVLPSDNFLHFQRFSHMKVPRQVRRQ